jgi:hypothetical protein
VNGYIQIKLSKKQALSLIELIEDELDTGEPEASDRPALESAAKIIQRGIDSLEARLERMSQY